MSSPYEITDFEKREVIIEATKMAASAHSRLGWILVLQGVIAVLLLLIGLQMVK